MEAFRDKHRLPARLATFNGCRYCFAIIGGHKFQVGFVYCQTGVEVVFFVCSAVQKLLFCDNCITYPDFYLGDRISRLYSLDTFGNF